MTGSLGPLLLLYAGIKRPQPGAVAGALAAGSYAPAPQSGTRVGQFRLHQCHPGAAGAQCAAHGVCIRLLLPRRTGTGRPDRPCRGSQAALEGLPGQPAGGHGAQHAGLRGQRPVLDGGDALGHRCCATPPPRSDPGIASPGLRADHHRQGDCSQLRSLWPAPARLSLPSRPTTPGADRVCPRAAGHLRGFDHRSGRRAASGSPRSARRSTSSTASSGSSSPTSPTSCARPSR